MIRRTMDASLLNEVANGPEVRPLLGGSGQIDLAPVLADPRNVALVTDLGGYVFTQHEATVYEGHTIFPLGSGQQAGRAIEEALRWLFTRTDCQEVVTKVSKNNRAAGLMVRQVGFERLFDRDAAWPEFDGSMAPGSFFGLSIGRWAQRDREAGRLGHIFHDRLEAAKVAAGSDLPVHGDDQAHDQAVGAAALMILAGNPAKGVWSYNRWARLAGYQTIEIVSLAPLVIDVRDALVTVENGEMEVLTCRQAH